MNLDNSNADYATVEWTICNFSTFLADPLNMIVSDEFELPRSGTRWVIELYGSWKNDKSYPSDEQIKLRVLLRNTSEEHIPGATVKCVFCLSSFQDVLWRSDECNLYLTRGTFIQDGFTRSWPRFKLFTGPNLDYDVMFVSCEMELVINSLDQTSDESLDFESLSNDLVDFWNDGERGNVELVTPEGNVLAHKEILSARSEIFANLLATGSNKISAPFSKEAVKMMLTYIYSAKIPEVLNPPVPDLYECASSFGISGLVAALEPETLNAESTIATYDCIQLFDIRNFSRGHIVTVKSEIFQCEPVLFRVSLNRSESTDNNYVFFFVEMWSKCDASCLSLGVKILDDVDEWVTSQTALLRPLAYSGFSKAFWFQEFRDPNFRMYGASKLQLVLRLRIRPYAVCQGGVVWKNPDYDPSAVFNKNKSLQRHLKELLKSSAYADASITSFTVAGHVMKVHKSVLCARSPVFGAAFGRTNFIFSDLPQTVLRQMLSYIYTGSLDCNQPQSLIKLHMAAEKYGITRLKESCVRMAEKASLTPQSVCSLWLFAAMTGQLDLKNKCIDFITNNLDSPPDTRGGTHLKTELGELCLNMLKAVG